MLLDLLNALPNIRVEPLFLNIGPHPELYCLERICQQVSRKYEQSFDNVLGHGVLLIAKSVPELKS